MDYESLVRTFSELRIVVVGDLMLDRYVAGRVRRISPEAPVPVVEVERTFERPGGAGNVAANLRQLGATTTIIGVVGADPDGRCLRNALTSAGLAADSLVVVESRPTTVKTRIVAHGQQIVRVDRELALIGSRVVAEDILSAFQQAGACQAIVLSDYAKGVLTPLVCAELIRLARQRGILVIVDPKGCDYRKYSGATAVTPNQFEAAQAINADRDREPSVSELQRFFLGQLGLRAALITQGEQGLTLLTPDADPISYAATARDVADVTGAGDTVVSVFTLCLAAGAALSEAAAIANAAAGVVVSKAGTATITTSELLEALHARPAAQLGRARA
jgi:D-beta-D-heptose 7-phosphate kinase/D-beta-D-heptose 1-phosphate adenosyltransferase